MSTPSLSLVESLIGAIPFEEGAALVARVGERASITAKSGSIEVGSVALTVEAMDDLIAHVLPPDQLESLQENGTVHFEFTPPVIGGDFGVLAASTPGDRWLEIRRRNTATTTPRPVRATDNVPAPAPAAPAPPPVSTAAEEAEVAAQLLARFHTPQAPATPNVAPPSRPVPAPPTAAAAPAVDPGFDLPARLMAGAPLPQEPTVSATPNPGANDDLAVPANLEFASAKSHFDLDSLSLPDTLPQRSAVDAFETEAAPTHLENTDRFQTRQPEASGMATSRFSTFVAPPSPGGSRSVVMLSVVLGIVALAGAGWFAAQRYLLTPSVAVAAPTPPASHPAPKPKADSQKALAAAPTIPTPKAPAAAAPTAAASAARPNTERAISKQNAEPTIRASAPALPVPHEGFAIQVAAVRERDEADRMVARLVNEGYSGYLVRGQGAAADFYRVRVGAFKNRQEAEEVAAKLERSEGVKPWIVKEAP